jgi:hypothetical protein
VLAKCFFEYQANLKTTATISIRSGQYLLPRFFNEIREGKVEQCLSNKVLRLVRWLSVHGLQLTFLIDNYMSETDSFSAVAP